MSSASLRLRSLLPSSTTVILRRCLIATMPDLAFSDCSFFTCAAIRIVRLGICNTELRDPRSVDTMLPTVLRLVGRVTSLVLSRSCTCWSLRLSPFVSGEEGDSFSTWTLNFCLLFRQPQQLSIMLHFFFRSYDHSVLCIHTCTRYPRFNITQLQLQLPTWP